MRKFFGYLLPGNLLERRGTELTLLLVVAGVLDVAAGVGLAYVAGFSQVRAALGSFDWPWLIAVVGGLLISFVGYYYAYRGIFRVAGGPDLSRAQMRAVVAAGFGGFLAHGGGTLDKYALEAAGADEDEAKVRVSGLAGLEHGVLSIIGCAAAIVVLAADHSATPGDVSIPWAVLPVPGFLIAFWLAERYRGRLDSCIFPRLWHRHGVHPPHRATGRGWRPHARASGHDHVLRCATRASRRRNIRLPGTRAVAASARILGRAPDAARHGRAPRPARRGRSPVTAGARAATQQPGEVSHRAADPVGSAP